jgi:pseudaminic acid cytidylyltransferase
MKNVAIIPARGGSKRLPRKNILPLNGKPMISYPINAALQSGVFDQVIVSTEDKEIQDIARECGAEIVARPDEMATDTAHELEAISYTLDQLPEMPEAFCVIYPTAAFILPTDLAEAREKLDAPVESDVVMGVSEFDIHPYKSLQTNADGFLEMKYPKECVMRSQTYPHLVASNGTFYWLRTDAYLKNRAYYQDRLVGHEVPSDRAVDIDTQADYDWAQKLAKMVDL